MQQDKISLRGAAGLTGCNILLNCWVAGEDGGTEWRGELRNAPDRLLLLRAATLRCWPLSPLLLGWSGPCGGGERGGATAVTPPTPPTPPQISRPALRTTANLPPCYAEQVYLPTNRLNSKLVAVWLSGVLIQGQSGQPDWRAGTAPGYHSRATANRHTRCCLSQIRSSVRIKIK